MKRYIPTVHGMVPRDDGDWVRHSDHVAALDSARAESAGEIKRLSAWRADAESEVSALLANRAQTAWEMKELRARVAELEAQVERDREWDRDHA